MKGKTIDGRQRQHSVAGSGAWLSVPWLIAGLAAGAVFVPACGQELEGDWLRATANDAATPATGDLAVEVALTATQVTAASYAITAADLAQPLTGSLRVDNGSVTGTINGVPAGAARRLSVFGYFDGSLVCAGEAVIDVVPYQVQSVLLTLQCEDVVGQIAVRATFDPRAPIDSASVTVTTPEGAEPIVVPMQREPGVVDAVISAIAAGTGRSLLVETFAGGVRICHAEATIDVPAGTTTTLADLVLACDSGPGALAVSGTAGFRPNLHGIGASLVSAEVGSTIELWVVATDPDGDALTYAWNDGTGSADRFGNANAATTTWNTGGLAVGNYELNLSVSDGETAPVAARLSIDLFAPRPRVVISEILYDAIGADSRDAFVELFGPPGTSLNGFRLVGVNGADGSPYQPVALNAVTLNDAGFAVIVHPDSQVANPSLFALAALAANVDYQNGPDAVELRWGDIVVDAVGYGYGGEGTPAALVQAGQSLTRDAAATDTDNNAADFCASASPSPGAPPTAACVR